MKKLIQLDSKVLFPCGASIATGIVVVIRQDGSLIIQHDDCSAAVSVFQLSEVTLLN